MGYGKIIGWGSQNFRLVGSREYICSERVKVSGYEVCFDIEVWREGYNKWLEVFITSDDLASEYRLVISLTACKMEPIIEWAILKWNMWWYA